MSNEELLKYLIAEIDLIMHDKDYRFENDDGTWYSRESCRDLTNQEVFEELKTELRELANLETKLTESQHESQEFISKYRYWRGECAELNKQLAEKDTKLHEYIRCALEDYSDNQKEIIELKQQLAEKEGKIETLKQRIDSIVKIYSDDFVSKDTELKELRHKVKQHNQDKISFALEQLEKVKEACEEIPQCDEYGDDWVLLSGLTEYIDNQIAELTHQHEDKGENK